MTRNAAAVQDLFERDMYPVLSSDGREEFVPYHMLAAHELTATKNHCQNLQELAERGGLCWSEILSILMDRKWGEFSGGKDAEIRAKEAVMRFITQDKKVRQ